MTLVVVDAQHVFADPDSDWAAPRFGEIVPRLEELLSAFGDDVVFTRFVAPLDPQGAWRDYYAQWPFARQPASAPLWDLVDAFAARPTLDYDTFGKWDERLAEAVRDEVVVAGVSTDCCVVSTVLPAADSGLPVRVVTDACAGATDESHAAALSVMGLYAPLVELTTTATEVGRRRR